MCPEFQLTDCSSMLWHQLIFHISKSTFWSFCLVFNLFVLFILSIFITSIHSTCLNYHFHSILLFISPPTEESNKRQILFEESWQRNRTRVSEKGNIINYDFVGTKIYVKGLLWTGARYIIVTQRLTWTYFFRCFFDNELLHYRVCRSILWKEKVKTV